MNIKDNKIHLRRIFRMYFCATINQFSLTYVRSDKYLFTKMDVNHNHNTNMNACK